MAAVTITVNATTKLWSRTGTGIISYPSTVDIAAGGPYDANPVTVPFDPVNQTGGLFYELKTGPSIGFLVSAHTNELGYGDITINDGQPGSELGGEPVINSLADWRVLIKGMTSAGSVGITFNTTTKLWTRTSTGIISYPSVTNMPAGGPYDANPIIVPFDPVNQTGGSFYELKTGPHVGYLVSAHTNDLGYGDITVGTPTGGSVDRGPGAVIATIHHPNPHVTGFSKHYNRGGEFHMTLLVDDPNVLIPVPKQTHYAVEFEQEPAGSDVWVEVAAGMIWDIDATETEVVYTGIDYLALYTYVVDERFDPNHINAAPPTGSYYSARKISDIIASQLQYAHDEPNSPVKFIQIGSIDDMPESVSIYSTFTDVLGFTTGLLDSHRAGTGKFSQVDVYKDGAGYKIRVRDNPGVNRDRMLVQYGGLCQGYHIIPYGKTWYDRVPVVGRDLHGIKAQWQAINSPVDQSLVGRLTSPVQYFDALDDSDLKRRSDQAAIDASRVGRQLGIGTAVGSFRPWQGYDLLDNLPIQIIHGAIDTTKMSNDVFGADPSTDPSVIVASYWAIIGLIWESYDDGHWVTTPLLWPRGIAPLRAVCTFVAPDVITGANSSVDLLGGAITSILNTFVPAFGGPLIPESGPMRPTGHTLTGVDHAGTPLVLLGPMGDQPNDGTLFGISPSVTNGIETVTARWVWDMGSPVAMCRILVLLNLIEDLPDISIQASVDGSTWDTIIDAATLTPQANIRPSAIVTVTNTNLYQYWALYFERTTLGGLEYFGALSIEGVLFWSSSLRAIAP